MPPAAPRVLPRTLVTAFGILCVSGLAAGQGAPGQTKVEGQVVGPDDPNLQYDISRHGVHFGTVVAKGSRVAALIDGVEGPRFDEILPVAGGTNNRVSFSADGSRYAYVGRQGQEFVVIVDGKEALRVPVSTASIDPAFNLPSIGFTANGRHVYFLLHTHISTNLGQDFTQFYYDGQPGPRSYGAPTIFLSPSGDRYAYMVTNPLHHEQQALLVDGKPAGYPPPGYVVQQGVGGEFRFTGDGAHLFVKASVPRSAAEQIFLDGRPFLRANSAMLYTAPVGNAFATVVTQGAPNGPTAQFIDIAGKKVPGSEGNRIDSIRWSPDGIHWAAKVSTGPQSMFVIADGKKGEEYQHIGEIDFTAAGTVVYDATSNGKNFVITGEKESDGYDIIQSTVSFAGAKAKSNQIAGGHIGFIATPGGRAGWLVVVDGKAWTGQNARDLTLSPDGSRFAFDFDGGYDVDGTAITGPGLLTFQQKLINQYVMPPGRFLFSPDSKHLVAFGRQAGTNTPGIYTDGKFLAAGGGFAVAPTFTPDSKHLFWMDRLPSDPHFVVYLDGKVVLTLDSNYRMMNSPGYWEMFADGVLTLVGPTDEGVKRIRITPGSDTSIETLLAKAH
jgi:hypothetical protein